MVTLNDIPLEYLVDWAKNHRSAHSDLTYLNTIAVKNANRLQDCWGVVAPRIPSSKHMRDLNEALRLCEPIITQDYDEDSKVITLPVNASACSSFYERLLAFIREFRMEMEWKQSSGKARASSNYNQHITIFRESFESSPLHCGHTSQEALAAQLGISGQRVDQIMSMIIPEVSSCLMGNKVGRVVADPLLAREFLAFRQGVGAMVSVESFCNASGVPIEDRRTLDFLTSILGMKLGEQVTGVPIVVVGRKGLFREYKGAIGQVLAFFRKEVIGIRVDIELKTLLNGIANDDLREALRSLILCSDEFIKYDDNGHQAVALRWDLLQYIPSRIAWILYVEGAFDYSTSIHEKDLVKKYNSLAKLFGAEKITAAQLPSRAALGDCWRPMCLGRSCFWKIRTTQNETYNIDDYIQRFLRKNGTNTPFSEFINAVKKDGQYKLFKSEKSLKTRYVNNGGQTGRKVAVRTAVSRLRAEERKKRMEDILSILDSAARTMTMQELYSLFLSDYPGTNYTTFTMWVRELIEDGKMNAVVGTGRKPTYVCSISIPIARPSSRDDRVRENAIRLLSSLPTRSLSTRELYPQLIAALPPGVGAPLQVVSRALHVEPRLVFEGPTNNKMVKYV